MSITSLVFVLFIFIVFILYYTVPKKYQWGVLLASSLVFYTLSSKWGILYILVTASSIFGSAILIENNNKKTKSYLKENKESLSKEEKNKYKSTNKNKRKFILIATLVVNIGILCTLKYSHFAVEQINAVLSWLNWGLLSNDFKWLVPLGLSFYTFQAVGYIADVYWNKIPAQRNYLKMLLYVSFFPQITQGPISEYEQLSSELFKEHSFTYDNYSRGMQRMIWGFFKKMVIANMLSPYVEDVFANYKDYIGITCFIGIIAHSIQLYADFSGYMDIMCGICEVLDIQLAENFKRPFFSKSISEFWRRWHITLGVWVKTYIYYPISISKHSISLGKKLFKKYGKHVADCTTTTISLTVVWFVVGIWHGASWGYIIWGLLMGLIIIVSNWLEPVYKIIRAKLKIRNSNWFWRAFRVLRTCFLFSFIEVIPEVGTLSDGLELIKRVFTNPVMPVSFKFALPFVSSVLDFAVIVFSVILLFISSVLQRKKPIRDYFNKLPFILRALMLIFLLFLIVVFGVSVGGGIGGFMYAQF